MLQLHRLSDDDLKGILDQALEKDEILSQEKIKFEDNVLDNLIGISNGDARRMLNIFETAHFLAKDGLITKEAIEEAVKNSFLYYDRAGDRHYDTISAFIKSLRGSDPNAACYYLAKMILSGEDPEFIARRLVVFASEDIGNAVPHALNMAVSTLMAVKNIGMPESEIILSHCTTFLASSPKSNASYLAIKKAKDIAGKGDYPIPLHIRNAPTGLMKNIGYGKGYKYPHDFDGHFVAAEYLPDEIKDNVFYSPSGEGGEMTIRERLKKLWPGKYKT